MDELIVATGGDETVGVEETGTVHWHAGTGASMARMTTFLQAILTVQIFTG
jgi:hypothetical protein